MGKCSSSRLAMIETGHRGVWGYEGGIRVKD